MSHKMFLETAVVIKATNEYSPDRCVQTSQRVLTERPSPSRMRSEE